MASNIDEDYTSEILKDLPKHINVETWLKIKVEPTYVYRRCFNVDKTTLKQPWQGYVDLMLMTQCCFNVLISGWKGKLTQLTFIGVDKTALKQLCQYLLYWGSLESGSIIKQN